MNIQKDFRIPRAVKILEVIKVECSTGDGTKENPARDIIQYWDTKGNLLFAQDKWFEDKVKKFAYSPDTSADAD